MIKIGDVIMVRGRVVKTGRARDSQAYLQLEGPLGLRTGAIPEAMVVAVEQAAFSPKAGDRVGRGGAGDYLLVGIHDGSAWLEGVGLVPIAELTPLI